jgi:hypothetical protein
MSLVRPVGFVATLLLAAASLAGQGRRQQTPSILIESLAGADSLELYCEACHGSVGRGAASWRPNYGRDPPFDNPCAPKQRRLSARSRPRIY